MPERHTTGGAKEFSYSKEELDRIRKTDTNSTKEFKESYQKWQELRAQERAKEEVIRKQRRNLLIIAILLIIFAAFLLFLRFL